MHVPMTATQCAILEYIDTYKTHFFCPPTYREIAQRLEIAISVAFHNVYRLEQMGLVNRNQSRPRRKSRTVVVTRAGKLLLERWKREWEINAQISQPG